LNLISSLTWMRLHEQGSLSALLSAAQALYRPFGELATREQRGESMQQQSSAKGTGLRVIAAGRSDIGCVRAHNEDTIALCEPEDHTLLAQWGRLYVLADGAGGHAAGEVASRTAVETISTVYYQPMVSPEAIQVRSAVKHLNGPLEDVALPATRIEYAFLMAHARL
jgi:hypothetical protein